MLTPSDSVVLDRRLDYLCNVSGFPLKTLLRPGRNLRKITPLPPLTPTELEVVPILRRSHSIEGDAPSGRMSW